jgi:hypothetical protein
MTGLPPAHDALVLRTDFSDDQTWLEVCGLIGQTDPEHGFAAYVDCVSDPRYDGLTPAALVALAEHDPESRTYMCAVDLVTVQDPEHPVLVLDLHHMPGQTFRVTPAQMWGVENNLSVSNMDFVEFADAVDGGWRLPRLSGPRTGTRRGGKPAEPVVARVMGGSVGAARAAALGPARPGSPRSLVR